MARFIVQFKPSNIVLVVTSKKQRFVDDSTSDNETDCKRAIICQVFIDIRKRPSVKRVSNRVYNLQAVNYATKLCQKYFMQKAAFDYSVFGDS